MSITAARAPEAEPSGRLTAADDQIGGDDAYFVIPVTREHSRGSAIRRVLLAANVRAADTSRRRGATRSSRRAVRRERGTERSARGVLRVDLPGHRVRDERGRARVCAARAGTPGRRGSSRTGERLDADGAVRRWSFDAGRGALRGNARERLRRRRPGALAAGRRELYRRGPGSRVARHLRRAD